MNETKIEGVEFDLEAALETRRALDREMQAMTEQELEQEIVRELKLRFPEPWFCNWMYSVGRHLVHATASVRPRHACYVSVVRIDSLPTIAETALALLGVIRSIPLPTPPAAAGGVAEQLAEWCELMAQSHLTNIIALGRTSADEVAEAKFRRIAAHLRQPTRGQAATFELSEEDVEMWIEAEYPTDVIYSEIARSVARKFGDWVRVRIDSERPTVAAPASDASEDGPIDLDRLVARRLDQLRGLFAMNPSFAVVQMSQTARELSRHFPPKVPLATQPPGIREAADALDALLVRFRKFDVLPTAEEVDKALATYRTVTGPAAAKERG